MKDIAASTTATGREMLNAARIFTEIIFNMIVDTIKYGTYKDYEKQMKLLFTKKIDELIGEENVNELKQIKEGEPVERYYYLRIFKENRDLIDDKKFVDKKIGTNNKQEFNEWLYNKIQQLLKNHDIQPNVIYGDTDSIFIKFNIMDPETKETLKTHDALKISIELGIICSKLLHKILPQPQNMGYEKTYWPFEILSKKRYVGLKFEFDPNKCTQNSMGIVLKRRDNAPIVKIVIGGIVKSILDDKDPAKAVAFTKKLLHDILSGKYQLDKFIVTKTIKGPALTKEEAKIENQKSKDDRYYADRTRIVHAVLADRMADRDPGNKPQSNDRIPYAYILVDKEVDLQGDRVEHPDYIKDNNLQLDYLFYITNQIMKPALQFLEHVVDNPEKIFKSVIMKENNRRHGKRPVTYYFHMLEQIKQNNDDVFDDLENMEDEEENIEYFDNLFSCLVDKEIILPQKKKRRKNTTTKSKKTNKNQIKNNNLNFDNNQGGFILEV